MRNFILLSVAVWVFLLSAAEFKDTALVLLDSREENIVNADGTYKSVDRSVYQVVNYDGLLQLRVLPLHFNSDYGTLKVTELFITKPDGRKIVIDPEKNSSVTTESSQLDSEIFDPAQKVLNLSLPGLEIGDTVTCTSVSTITKPRMPGQWSDISVMEAPFPIVKCEYIVSLPASLPLQSICIKDELKGTLTFDQKKQNGRIIYRWQGKDIPRAVPENAMPPLYTCTQRILVSTVKNWEDISRWYDRLCAPHLAGVNEEMKLKTAGLIAGKKDDTAKVMALFQFVSQQIRYTGITDEETAPGYEPHDVVKTFNQRHGVCRDKAALLVAMLRLAGFKAYPALFMSGAPKDKEVANIYFNHAIVAWEKSPGVYQLMDPTFETTTEFFPGYLAGFPYLVARPEGETLRTAPLIRAEDNLLEIVTNVSCSRESFTVESRLEFSGIYDQMYRAAFSEWALKDIRVFFSSRLRHIVPGAKLEKLQIVPEKIRDMSRPLAVILHYVVPGIIRRDLPVQELQLPRSAMIFGLFESLYNNIALPERRFPLRANPRAVRETVNVIGLPEEDIELPKGVDIVENGLFRMQGKFRKNAGVLGEKFFFAIDSMQISPADYTKLKQTAAKAKSLWLTRPVIRRQNLPEKTTVNTEYLQYSRFYNLTGPRTREEHTHFVRKINFYAGVKEASNLTLTYIDQAETVDISATVTAPDGKKIQLSPKEITRMDSPVTSTAPRYFKRKLLTASFPGVQPGAVIDCNIVARKEKQLPFYADLLTVDDVPVRLHELIVEHPAKMPLKISDIPEKIQHSSTFGGKKLIRRYSANDCPGVTPEPGQPDYQWFVPTLRISGFDAANINSLLRTASDKVKAASPEIALLARKIAAAAPAKLPSSLHPETLKNPDKKAIAEISAAYAAEKYIYQHIRPVALPFNQMLPEEYSLPQTVLKDGYGNSVDRAILLAAILDALKIKFEFVPISDLPARKELLDILRKVPQNIFTGLLVKLPEYGLFLNSSGLYGTPGILNHQGMIRWDENGYSELETADSPIDGTHIECRMVLKEDAGADIILEYTFNGNSLEKEKERFSRFTPSLAGQFVEKLAAAVAPQALLRKWNFDPDSHSPHLTLELYVPDFVRKTGKFASIVLPEYRKLKYLASLPADPRRYAPFIFPGRQEVFLDYSIKLPPKWRPAASAGDDSADYLSLIWLRQNSFENLLYCRSFQLITDLPVVMPVNYPRLLEIDREIHRLENENILFITE